MARIRLATYRDALALQDSLWKCQALSDTPYPDPCIPYAAQRLMEMADMGQIAAAVDEDDRIVGCIILSRAHWAWVHPDNPRGWYIINEHFFVEPEHRHGGTALKLLKWAKEEAAKKGLPLMIDFSTIDADIEYKDRFARINGMTYTGGKFWYAPSKDE